MKRVLILLFVVLVVGCGDDPRKAEERSNFDRCVNRQAEAMAKLTSGDPRGDPNTAMVRVHQTHEAMQELKHGSVNDIERMDQQMTNIKNARTILAADAQKSPTHFLSDVNGVIRMALELDSSGVREDIEELRDAIRKAQR